MLQAMDTGGSGRGGSGALLQALLDNVEGGAGGIDDHGPAGGLEPLDMSLDLGLAGHSPGGLGRDVDRRAAEALVADEVATSRGRLGDAAVGGDSASAVEAAAAAPLASAEGSTSPVAVAHDQVPGAIPGASSAVLDGRYLSLMSSTGDAMPGCPIDFSAMDYAGWASTPKASEEALPVGAACRGEAATDRASGGVAGATPPLFLMDDLAEGTDSGSPVSRAADEVAATRPPSGALPAAAAAVTATADDASASSTSASADGLYGTTKISGESFSCSLLDSSPYRPDDLSVADATCRNSTLGALLPGESVRVAPGTTPPDKGRPLAEPLAAAVANGLNGSVGVLPPSSPILSNKAGSASTPTLAVGPAPAGRSAKEVAATAASAVNLAAAATAAAAASSAASAAMAAAAAAATESGPSLSQMMALTTEAARATVASAASAASPATSTLSSASASATRRPTSTGITETGGCAPGKCSAGEVRKRASPAGKAPRACALSNAAAVLSSLVPFPSTAAPSAAAMASAATAGLLVRPSLPCAGGAAAAVSSPAYAAAASAAAAAAASVAAGRVFPLSPAEGAVRSAATATARASAAGRLRAKRARARTHAGNAVRYSVRKRIADVRPRVNGRFATKSELAKAKRGSLLEAPPPDDPAKGGGSHPSSPPPTGVVVAKVE